MSIGIAHPDFAQRAGINDPARFAGELALLLEGSTVTAQVSGDPYSAAVAKHMAKVLIDKRLAANSYPCRAAVSKLPNIVLRSQFGLPPDQLLTHINHNFAHLLIRFHILVGRDDLLECKSAVNDRL